jgi:hypothetical protein
MAKPKLGDREAKDILLRWPTRTKKLWSTPRGSGYWLQAQPKGVGSTAPTPTIRVPGAELFSTQPDGMWVFLSDDSFADVVSIEVCRTAQNLNDKRSRYSAAVRSLVLHCPLHWLQDEIVVPKSGKITRWKAARTIGKAPTNELVLPVRFLRVLYSLANDLYASWTAHNVPGGHEYFCRHSSLDSYNSQAMQTFLRQMSFGMHFLTIAGK